MLPVIYTIRKVEQETPDVFTLTLVNKNDESGMAFLPGQFNMLYPFGIGEAAISISSDPANPETLQHTIRAVGSVTQGLHKVKPGDEIAVRGPYGKPWPLAKKHCDVLVIAGGVGIAPLRSALYQLAGQKQDYGQITLLYGARTPEDIVFQKDLRHWKKQGLEVKVTVDHGGPDWTGHVGVVTLLIRKYIHHANNTLVLVCGPEIMMRFAVQELMRAGIDDRNIYLSLERNMQCATGFCGHCQYGPYFLCKDGPVFSYGQVKNWLNIKEL